MKMNEGIINIIKAIADLVIAIVEATAGSQNNAELPDSSKTIQTTGTIKNEL